MRRTSQMKYIIVIVCMLFLRPLYSGAEEVGLQHPLRHQAVPKPMLLEERADLWADKVINDIGSSVGICSYFTQLMGVFCVREIQLQREGLLRWIALLPEERKRLRKTHEGLKRGLVGLRIEEYESILDEIDRQDTLTVEDFAHYTLTHEFWPSLNDREKIEEWFSLTLEEISRQDYSWWPFYTGTEKKIAVPENDAQKLIEWIALTSYQRDLERLKNIVQGKLRFELQLNLYREDRNLRAVIRHIEARDTLTRSLRNQERLATWSSRTFEERNRWRIQGSNEDDHLRYEIFLLIEKNEHVAISVKEFLGEDFTNELFRIKNQDRDEDYQHIEETINWWASLSREERETFSEQRQGIRERIKFSRYLNQQDFEESIALLEENDFLERYEYYKQQIEDYASLSYEEREELRKNDLDNLLARYRRHGSIPWFLEYQWFRDAERVKRLTEELNTMIRTIEIQDNNAREEQIYQEATMILETSFNDVEKDDLNAFFGGYRNVRIKLFPINGAICPEYPQTQREEMRLLQIADAGAGLRLEVHDNESQTVLLLADKVHNVELRINEPDNLNHRDNLVNYKTDDGEVVNYRLGQLIKSDTIQENYHIKVIPREYLDPVQVKWGRSQREIDKLFRGHFRIEVTKKRNSSQTEWSLVNDIPVDWYLRSVTPGELHLKDANLEALKAQTIASRTYALSKALDNTLVSHQGWDLDPSTSYQIYHGVEREHEKSNQAVASTMGVVLTRDNRLVETEYHACVPTTTVGTDSNPILQARNIPGRIGCSSYKGRGGHGRGLSQIATVYLTTDGWTDLNRNVPSSDARVPEDIHLPWDYKSILYYFYEGIELTNFLDL